MMTCTAKELCAATGGTLVQDGEGFSCVSTDSRRVEQGCLFIPLVGERFDGHTYLTQALENGAAGCLCSRLPEALDYDAAARTLALADPRWNSQPALYAALRLSREPYLPAQLAVTSAELTAAHIRGGRQAWVLRGLLDAVIAAPQINFPEALLALAKTLAGQA